MTDCVIIDYCFLNIYGLDNPTDIRNNFYKLGGSYEKYNE